jgi:hypothetical protein
MVRQSGVGLGAVGDELAFADSISFGPPSSTVPESRSRHMTQGC